MRLSGQPAARRSRVWVSQAKGSTLLRRAVISSVAMVAQVRPPPVLTWFQQLLFACLPEHKLLDGIASDLPSRDASLLAAAREDASLTGKRGLLHALRAAGASAAS